MVIGIKSGIVSATATGVNAVDFDGSSYLQRGGELTGAADTKDYTASIWIYPTASAVAGLIVGDRFQLYLNGSEQVIVSLVSTDGTQAALAVSTASDITLNAWNHIMIGIDCAAGDADIWVNDSAVTLTTDTVNNKVIDYTNGDVIIGGRAVASQLLTGGMAEAWLDDTYLDPRTLGNRRKFIKSDGTPADVGSDGSTPTGASPLIYLRGPAGSWNTNKGTGGGFSLVGSLPQSGDLPVDV